MVIKSPKLGLKISLCLGLTVVLTLFTIGKTQINITVQDGYETFMAMDLGFSSSRNLSDIGGGQFSQPMYRRLVVLVRSIPEFIRYKLGYIQNYSFDRMDLDIKFPDFQQIMNDREEAIKSGILLDAEAVNVNAI